MYKWLHLCKYIISVSGACGGQEKVSDHCNWKAVSCEPKGTQVLRQ